MDVTESELARALYGLEVTIREPEPSASVVGSPEGWKPFSARGKCLHPGDVLADLKARIADERKRRAVEIAECRAEGARCDREGGPCTCPCDPEAEAAALAPGEPVDPELAVIARMVTDLDGIADALTGRPAGSAWRVLHYLADRYGFVLATED